MKRKLLAITLTLALLVGLVSATGVMMTSAAAVNLGTPVTSVDDLPTEPNLIAGHTPKTLAGGAVSVSNGALANVTDGLVQGINQPIHFDITDEETFVKSDKTYYRPLVDAAYVAKYFPDYDQNKTWYLQTENDWYSATNATPTRAMISGGNNAKLVYDLGGMATIDELMIASTHELKNLFYLGNQTGKEQQLSYTLAQLEAQMTAPQKGDSLLYTVKVYIAEDKADLENPDNLVLDYAYDKNTMDIVSRYVLEAPVRGRYIHFDLSQSVNGNLTRISELAVYGETDALPFTTVTTDNVTFLTDENDASLVPPLSENLLVDVTNSTEVSNTNWYAQTNYKTYNTETGAIGSVSVQNGQNLVDGVIYKVNSTSNLQSLFTVPNKYAEFVAPSEATTGCIVVDLGEAKSLDKVLLGFATDTNDLLRQWFGRVYVANDINGIVDDANFVGSWSYVQNNVVGTVADRGMLMSLGGVEARYVAFEMPVNALGWSGDAGKSIRVCEMGVYAMPQNFAVVGAQIRTNASALPAGSGAVALRFANTLTCEGVTLNGYVADYTAATVTVGGVACPIVEVGTLVTTESYITRNNLQPIDALVYGSTVAKAVPAKNIYSQAADKSAITYTAVVTNVPYNRYGEDMLARAYVRYTTPQGEQVMYGDIVERNVYDVWATDAPTEREVLDRADYLNDGSGYFEQGSRVVFLGDSITNNSAFIAETFCYYAAKYPQDKVEMYMAGVKGGTAEGGLAFLEDQVLALNPDYVSIMFAMNDINREGYSNGYANASAQQKAYIDTYAANMEQIVQKLQAKGVKVIICTPTPFDETCTSANQWNYPGCFEALQVCAEKARALATKYGCELVDFNAPMSEAVLYVQDTANGGNPAYTIIGTDHVHPGTLGHDMMARIWLNTMGEDVTVPTNEMLLNCLKGTASVNAKFEDLGTEFSNKVKAVSTTGINGSANYAVCSYYEGEFFFVGPANHDTMTLQEKIDKVATYNGQYTGDWRGQTCIPQFATNAANLGANRYAVQQAIKGVYN